MDKCGIITFHRTSNFGSCLQAYGLYKAIADLGYDCELIDYRCPAIEVREGLSNRYSFTPKGILRRILYQPTTNKRYKSLMGFLTEHAKLSDPYTPQTVKATNSHYSKFMVGSDIVWGIDITENDYNYFLDFVEQPEKKFAFSASVGNHDVSRAAPEISRLLSDFQKIAVREEAAIPWVQQLSGKTAQWVCDPTMLLTAGQWDAIVKPKPYQDDYVLVYFQDEHGKCLQDAKRYAAAHGLRVRFICYGVKPIKGIHSDKITSLQEFLGLIRNAKCVFTASYHGMLFSLYYHKEFVFYSRAHSDRVHSLAQRLGVQNQCGDQMQIEAYQPVDYVQVEEKIRTFREESLSVLAEMLRNE